MILHVDMDAFFASIEQRDNPQLRGKPVVVGGSKTGRGVVAAASYEARKFGVHSAMSGHRAVQLCPDAIFVKSNARYYAEVGRQVREILFEFSPIIQPLSCDEAFLDVSGTLPHFSSVQTLAQQIKREILDRLQLTASVGAAPLKFIAKIASDIGKPNGCVVVEPCDMHAFLDPLPISRLWGVGRVAESKLHRLGLRTIGDIRKIKHEDRNHFGRWFQHLHDLACCIDPRPVVTDHSAKQISHERTFAEDINDLDILLAVANFLTDQTCRRLRNSNRQARSVTIKYRTHDFKTYSRSSTFDRGVDHLDQVWNEVAKLLRLVHQQYPVPVRLIGVGLADLTKPNAPRQLDLFDTKASDQLAKVDSVTDAISKRLGDYAVYRGTAHEWAKNKLVKEMNTMRNLPDDDLESSKQK